MTDLDTRGRAAAAALKDSLADAPVPELRVADRPSRAPWLLAAAAVVMVALVASAVALRGGGNGDAGLATEPPAEVPRLILDPVPEGLEPTGRVELPVHQGASDFELPGMDLWLYGSPDDPLGQPSLVASTIDAAEGLSAGDGEELEVAGHEATLRRGRDGMPDGGVLTLGVDLGKEGLVGVMSRDLDRAALVAAAEELLATGEPVMPDELDSGLVQVAQTPDVRFDVMTVFLPSERGSGVGYASADHERSLQLLAVGGDDDDLLLARWMLGPEAREVELRGTTGWLGSPYAGAHSLVWQESPGVLVAVTGSVGEEALLEAAASLRPATDEEWDALPRSNGGEVITTFEDEGDVVTPTSVIEPETTPTSVVDDGPLSGSEGRTASLDGTIGGLRWTFYTNADNDFCYETESSASCGGSVGGGPASQVAAIQHRGEIVVFALLDEPVPAIPSVALTGCGEDPPPMQLAETPGSSVLAAGSCADPTVRPEGIVAFGEDGSEILRLPVEFVEAVNG